jgi:hypothetical protein
MKKTVVVAALAAGTACSPADTLGDAIKQAMGGNAGRGEQTADAAGKAEGSAAPGGGLDDGARTDSRGGEPGQGQAGSQGAAAGVGFDSRAADSALTAGFAGQGEAPASQANDVDEDEARWQTKAALHRAPDEGASVELRNDVWVVNMCPDSVTVSSWPEAKATWGETLARMPEPYRSEANHPVVEMGLDYHYAGYVGSYKVTVAPCTDRSYTEPPTSKLDESDAIVPAGRGYLAVKLDVDYCEFNEKDGRVEAEESDEYKSVKQYVVTIRPSEAGNTLAASGGALYSVLKPDGRTTNAYTGKRALGADEAARLSGTWFTLGDDEPTRTPVGGEAWPLYDGGQYKPYYDGAWWIGGNKVGQVVFDLAHEATLEDRLGYDTLTAQTTVTFGDGTKGEAYMLLKYDPGTGLTVATFNREPTFLAQLTPEQLAAEEASWPRIEAGDYGALTFLGATYEAPFE